MLAEHLDHPLRRAVALVDGDHPPPGGEVSPDVGDHVLDVAAVGLGRLGRDLPRVLVGVQAERADPPPRLPLLEHLAADVGDAAQGRGAEVDRCGAAGGRGGPAGVEELLAGRDQVVGPGAHALGVEHEHVGLGREQLDEHLHLVDQRRRERLHPLDGHALGQLVGELGQLGVLLPQLGGATAYVVGEQQLAARRRPQSGHGLEGALVGDGEGADLVDLVAEELHPDGVLLGRREDVDDASTDGELAALLHEVDAGVGRAGEPAYDVLELDLLAGSELDGDQVGEPLDLGLEHGPHRRDDDAERTVVGLVAGVLDPAQDGEAAPDGVAARAEALVREGLPGRVERDRGRVEHVLELLGEVLRLAHGGGDDEHRAARVDEPLDHERAQRRRAGQVEDRHARLRVVHRPREGRLTQDQVGQGGDGHGGSSRTGRARMTTPSQLDRGLAPVYEVAPTALVRRWSATGAPGPCSGGPPPGDAVTMWQVVRGLLLGALVGVVLGSLARALMRLVAIGMGVGVEPEFHLGVSLAIVSLFVLAGGGAGLARSLTLKAWQSALIVLATTVPLWLMAGAFALGETQDILDLDLTPPWTVELLAMAALIIGLVLVTPYAGWRTGRPRRRPAQAPEYATSRR